MVKDWEPTSDGISPEPPYTMNEVKKRSVGYVRKVDYDFLKRQLSAAEARAELAEGELSNGHKALDAAGVPGYDDNGGLSICGRVYQLRICAEALRAENERLREALKAVEWIFDAYWSEPSCYKAFYCPWCGGRNEYPFDKAPEHRPGCRRQAALRGSEDRNAHSYRVVDSFGCSCATCQAIRRQDGRGEEEA